MVHTNVHVGMYGRISVRKKPTKKAKALKYTLMPTLKKIGGRI